MNISVFLNAIDKFPRFHIYWQIETNRNKSKIRITDVDIEAVKHYQVIWQNIFLFKKITQQQMFVEILIPVDTSKSQNHRKMSKI
jgi:hypothetical protein